MRFLLANFLQSNWVLVVLLIVSIVALMFASFSRKRKEQQYYDDLSAKIVKGAKVKTFGGLYGTVVSVRNTTDGKIVLIETGEGDKVSYQQLHIKAIYGIDDSEEMVIDSEGNEVPISELNNSKEESVEEKPKIEAATEENTEATDETEGKNKKNKKSAKKQAE